MSIEMGWSRAVSRQVAVCAILHVSCKADVLEGEGLEFVRYKRERSRGDLCGRICGDGGVCDWRVDRGGWCREL